MKRDILSPLWQRALFIGVLLLAAGLPAHGQTPTVGAHRFEIGADDFLLDGQPFVIRCGELHAPRVPQEYWRHRLQMVRAMGLNTVCAYLFWNLHEPQPGQYNWSGQADVAAFCREAQAQGLWVILRPGPYACAEWEMGGLPWWLLKHDDIQLRSRDARFLDAARRYLKEVGRVLAPLQVSRGGPILMVQVENEYGFYGDDAEYMGELRQALLDAGFEVPLFACDPKQQLRNAYRRDLFPVVNFGSDPQGGFAALREILPRGPLMCGEFYPGWFDTWGARHHTGNTAQYLADLGYMLGQRASFSIYMAHGGTSFGFSTGADRPFKPDTSSYDYDAPISEAGWVTPKFQQTRALIEKHLAAGEQLPEPPARNPVIQIAPAVATQRAALRANLPTTVLTDKEPHTMEAYDQGFGCILYRTSLPPGPAATLEAAAVHDVGQIFLDGKRIGFTDRRSRNFRVQIPARSDIATLDVLVEAMGRVNFGVEMHDRKGLHRPVTLTWSGGDKVELRDWQVFRFPLDAPQLAGLKFVAADAAGAAPEPAFWRATVRIGAPGDCFLDMRPWGKGFVWVNGHNLGRYWNIGPQQTMYVPAPWLKPGDNEIVVLDLLGPTAPIVLGLDHPILDELRPALDFSHSQRRTVELRSDWGAPAGSGRLAGGSDLQEVRFRQPARGRYFCFEALDAQDGKPQAAIAELSLLDAEGKPLGVNGWTIAYVDSEEREQADGAAENAIDGQTANFWATEWGSRQPGYPHRLVIDLAEPCTIGGFRYVPRQGAPDVPGRIKDYRVYLVDELEPK